MLSESTAICSYFERQDPTRAIYPRDNRAYAKTLYFEQYITGAVFNKVVRELFHETFVRPNIDKVPTDPLKIDAVLVHALPEIFGYLESVLGDSFLTGNEVTVADWHLASSLVTMQYIGYPLYAARFPHLAAHFGRTIRTPAMMQALRDEQPVVQSMGLDSRFLRAAFG